MTGTIALSHELDASGLSVPAVLTPSTPSAQSDPTRRYRHPHFNWVEAGQANQTHWSFKPFTGREQEPSYPDGLWNDQALNGEQRAAVSAQYKVARILWSQARLRRHAAPLLRKAAPLWTAWATAHAKLTEVYAQFWETADGRWRAQLLRLTDAESSAENAAREWDAVAKDLAELEPAQVETAGYDYKLPLTTVAEELGLDASSWQIEDVFQYRCSSWSTGAPASDSLGRRIAEQRARLLEVANLAGDLQRG